MKKPLILFSLVLTTLPLTNCSSKDNEDALPPIEAEEIDPVQQEQFVTITNMKSESGTELPYSEPTEIKLGDTLKTEDSAMIIKVESNKITLNWNELEKFNEQEGLLPPDTSEVYYFDFTDPILENKQATYNEANSTIKPTEIKIESPARLKIVYGSGTELSDTLKTEVDIK